MSFINIYFLFGLIFIAVPILLHIFNRRKKVQQHWAATQFLVDSISKRKHKIVLEDSLILITRSLIITFVVLSLARPLVLHTSKIPWELVLTIFFSGMLIFSASFAIWEQKKLRSSLLVFSSLLIIIAFSLIIFEKAREVTRFMVLNPQDVVIIIDSSSSMSREASDGTLYNIAKKEAEELIKTSVKGTCFSIIQSADKSKTYNEIPIADRNILLSLLDKVQLFGGTFNIQYALKTALNSLEKGNNIGKTIIIFSDGQNSNWDADVKGVWSKYKNEFLKFKNEPRIILKRINTPIVKRNLAIEKVELSNSKIFAGIDFLTKITIANTGNEAITAKKIFIKNKGKVVAEKSLPQIQQGDKFTIELPLQINKVGANILNIQLTVNDELNWDNSLNYPVIVFKPLSVLIISDTKTSRSASNLEKILIPPETDDLKNSAFKIKRITARELLNYNSFNTYDALFLIDIPKLPHYTAEKIESFVKFGGSIFILPGNKIIPDFYNNWQTSSGNFLPVDFIGIDKTPNKKLQFPSNNKRINNKFSENIKEAVTLCDKASFSKTWEVSYDESDSNINIIAELNNGSPYIVEKKLKKGYVITFATPLEKSFSTLIYSEGIIPLIYETLFKFTKDLQPETIETTDNFSKILFPISTPNLPEDLYKSCKIFNGTSKTPRFTIIPTELGITKNLKDILNRKKNESYFIRWEAVITPNETSMYNVKITTNGKANLWINNEFVMQANKAKDGLDETKQIPLESDKTYVFRLEYTGFSPYKCELMWDNGSGWKKVNQKYFSNKQFVIKKELKRVSISLPQKRKPVNATLQRTVDGLELDYEPTYTGLHKVTFSPDLTKKLNETIVSPYFFNMTPPLSESYIKKLSHNEISNLYDYIGLQQIDQIDEMEKVLEGFDTGKEFWKYFAYGIILLFLSEVILTRWIALRRNIVTKEAEGKK